MTLIPTLETERLILRPLKADDFEAEAAFYASDRSRFVGGPLPRERAWTNFAAYAGHWLLRGFGMFAIEEKSTGLYCGRTGPYHPVGFPEQELGWSLMEHAEGRGIGLEAASAARHYIYTSLKWPTVISMILVGNDRSVKLAERMGATYERDFQHALFGLTVIYRHPSPEDLT